MKITLNIFLTPCVVFLAATSLFIWSISQLFISKYHLPRGLIFDNDFRWLLRSHVPRIIIPEALKEKNITLPQQPRFGDPNQYIGGIWSFERELFVCNIAKNSNTKLKYLFLEEHTGLNVSDLAATDWIHQGNEAGLWRSKYLPQDLYKYLMQSLAAPERNWRFIVFIRDPVERFLSGFKDKCIKDFPRVGAYQDRCKQKNMHEWLSYLRKQLSKKKICDVDHHFRPQWCWCDMVNSRALYEIHVFDKYNRDETFQDFLHEFNLLSHSHLFRTTSFNPTSVTGEQDFDIDFTKKDLKNFKEIYDIDYKLFEVPRRFPIITKPIT